MLYIYIGKVQLLVDWIFNGIVDEWN
jgi:hypothetical protein